jgi:hypothetical protein
MLIISMKAGFDTCLAFLNHFPLFALMLRVKDSRRLPGGIRFELRDALTKGPNDEDSPAVSYIHLEVCPIIKFMFTKNRSKFLVSSPSRSRSAPCSTNTSNLVIDYASII